VDVTSILKSTPGVEEKRHKRPQTYWTGTSNNVEFIMKWLI